MLYNGQSLIEVIPEREREEEKQTKEDREIQELLCLIILDSELSPLAPHPKRTSTSKY